MTRLARIKESLKARYATLMVRTEEDSDHREEIDRWKGRHLAAQSLLYLANEKLRECREAAEIVAGEHRREVAELRGKIDGWRHAAITAIEAHDALRVQMGQARVEVRQVHDELKRIADGVES